MNATRPPRGSVFLVEDEVMIRMMVSDMLEELGYTVVAEAGEIGEALRLAETTYFDLAILDVNVNGKVISPVADLIKARNRPFIFATGYGSSGLPEEYRDRPALQKPFQLETLGKMIDTTLRGEIGEALRLAETTFFDLAILDVNVNGKVISSVADLIKARNRPFIFATGYGSSGLPEEYRDRPALQKPFQLETLGRMIDTTMRGATV